MSLRSKIDNKAGKRPRVLVVDDESTIRRAMWFMLRTEFDVTTMDSGDKAIEQIRQGVDFDVVSLDIRMPGMSGTETLKAIKQWSPTTEVLIVTAYADIKSAKEAVKLGAYDFIDKPFGKDVFRTAIRKGVERRSKVIASNKAQEHLALVKAQLIESEKFSAIGELIAGVVHELNNPLTAVIGFSDLLLINEGSPEQTRKYLENIQRSALLCQRIIQKLLVFSRKQEPQREYVPIGHIIESTFELKQHGLNLDGIQVAKQLADNMPSTIADPYQLQQVFLNIINNAHQAMKQHTGTMMLTVKSEFDENVIRISFCDTGPGIPKENLQKIFEPFFTTKEKGKGTGLGLSVCYEIIQEHKGNIYVASEPERGACFVIELPILAKPLLSTPSSRERAQELAAQHILVLDEEEAERDLLKNMIPVLGHHVDVAADATTAQQKLREGNYDIIVSSLNMPELNGPQLYQYLSRVKPELLPRIIFITGGVVSDEIRRFLKRSSTPYINKPFRIPDIQKGIQKVVEASS